ncbi:MAG: SH3 domain-containing protein [Candidatus Omnitrophica bacterium]|nr:SH3 domain-containing protein [Candidatus Omnitrophota bacterium]MDD5429726.1 SH3 domain-containing protein [Candidatus Omnitrophota bacterium]
MKKKIFIVLLLCTWAFLSFPSDIFVTTKDNTNVREDSTVSSSILGSLPSEQTVEVLSESFGWYKIKIPAYISCYISGNFAREITPAEIEVTGKKVNLRSRPSLSGKIIGTVPERSRLKVFGQANGWFQVSGYPYAEGWIHGKLLKKFDGNFGLDTLEAVTKSRLNHDKYAEEKAIANFIEKSHEYLLPILKNKLPTADAGTSYSIISVLTFMGRKNPDVVFYLLESTRNAPVEVAAAYLDAVQNVILPEETKKTPYFYKAKNNTLSPEDIEESREILQQKYTDTICSLGQSQGQ